MSRLLQTSILSEVPIKLPKNAKLFFHQEKGLYFAVHYSHVVAVVTHTHPKQFLVAYNASPTSLNVLYAVASYLDIPINPDLYTAINETARLYNVDKNDYRSAWNYAHKPYTRAEWNDRISELEKFDYKKGLRYI